MFKCNYSLCLCLFLAVFCFSSCAQNDSGALKINIKPSNAKSNLILIDSVKFAKEILADSGLRSFFANYGNSNYSFVSTVSLSYATTPVIKKANIRNAFDTVFYKFMDRTFLNYKWDEIKRSKGKPYNILVTSIYEGDEKIMTVKVEEHYNDLFLPIYSHKIQLDSSLTGK